jgi:hypothetical protein
MQARRKVPLLQVGSMLALIVVLAGCTKGGQFDPTTILDNDMFDNKKPLQGQREPVFPNGVPGAATGIPADLYKGYQPPPDQATDNAAAVTPVLPPADNAARAEAEKRPKTESAKAKVVRARRKPRAEIRVGLAKHPKSTAQSAPQTSQTAWPAPPAAQTQSSGTAWPAPPAAQTQSSRTAWPAPPSTSQAQSSQTNWPAAPPAGNVQQSSQSIWPNPPASSGSTQ